MTPIAGALYQLLDFHTSLSLLDSNQHVTNAECLTIYNIQAPVDCNFQAQVNKTLNLLTLYILCISYTTQNCMHVMICKFHRQTFLHFPPKSNTQKKK